MPACQQFAVPGRGQRGAAGRWAGLPLLILLVALGGCGPSPIRGGTPGVLTSGENPVADVEVVVYAAQSAERLGYAVTGPDGTFQLVTADGLGPLRLSPGSYVATLQSVGAPTRLPSDYLDRQSTPLRFDWQQDGRIELNVPGLKRR